MTGRARSTARLFFNRILKTAQANHVDGFVKPQYGLLHKVGQSDREQKSQRKGPVTRPFLLFRPKGVDIFVTPRSNLRLTWPLRRARRRQIIRDLFMSTLRQFASRISLATAVAFSAQLVFAQDATAPADPTLSMGTTANAAPELKTKETAATGDLYLAGTFDLWELRCLKAADGKDPCRLYQLLKSADGNPTAEISIFNLPEGSQAVAGAAILVPLDTLLSANLAIAVDTNREMIYPYTVCGLDGCVARVGFSADQISQMKNGAAATLTIVPAGAPDQKVPVTMSLKGFTNGYDAVTAANAP